MDDVMNQYMDEIERHKGTFEPSRQEYLTFLFTYMSDMAEFYKVPHFYVAPAMVLALDNSLQLAKRMYDNNQPYRFEGVSDKEYELLVAKDIRKGASRMLFSGLENKIKRENKFPK